ncbi:MAG: 5-formyltetrahydrofolate cyclo-ligase [Lachnospiraceae bacterium]|nr:5-formyltetrahydrofolate cyclo-ligase [Lachnospiraceae bacterium]
MNLNISKKEIRDTILDIRKSFDTDYLNRLSTVICNRVLKQEAYISCKDLVLYMPINNEVNLDILMKQAFKDGKNIWMPRIINKNMEFYRYSKNIKLIKGTYGILEPDTDEILVPNDNTLIIMPGAAFSEDMGRIGYGGGYYDKYLSKHKYCKTIAVCYNFQIMPMLPMDEHDIKPDIIISDDNIFTKNK